jgi:hypothetical protein
VSDAKIQKRLVTFEIITKGERPVDLNDIVQDALISGLHKAVASTLNLEYKNEQGYNRRHDFVGVDIREIK